MHGTPYRISLVGIPKHVVTTISTFSFYNAAMGQNPNTHC
jgi:hypothetical protein